MRISKCFNFNKLIVFLIFFFFLFYTIYSFIGMPWEVLETNKNIYTQLSRTGPFAKLLLAFSFFLFFFYILLNLVNKKEKNTYIFLLFLLMVFSIFWILYSCVIDKITILVLLRDPLPPFTFMIPFAILIGMDENLWDEVKKILFVSAVILIVLSFVNTISFINQYGYGYRIVTSGSIFWFNKGFFLLFISLCFDNKNISWIKLFISFILILLMYFVVSQLQSRSWLLQLIILTVAYLIILSKKITNPYVMLPLILFTLLIIFINSNSYFEGLFNRFHVSGDTRTGQLNDFFSQNSFVDLLFGKGVNASYDMTGRGDFKYVDNQFLLSMFRYGIIPTVLYFIILIYPIFYMIKFKCKKVFLECIVIFSWLFASLGLSVYFNISFDISNFSIFFFVGKIIKEIELERER